MASYLIFYFKVLPPQPHPPKLPAFLTIWGNVERCGGKCWKAK